MYAKFIPDVTYAARIGHRFWSAGKGDNAANEATEWGNSAIVTYAFPDFPAKNFTISIPGLIDGACLLHLTQAGLVAALSLIL